MDFSDKLTELDPQGRYGPDRSDRDLIASIYPVSRETFERLTIYNALLNRWQQKTNLVAPTTLSQYWSRHVADAVQLMPIVRASCNELPARWIDIGSGGGFPGLVLAIMMAEEGSWQEYARITMVESIQKKCSFLRRVVVETGINQDHQLASIECARIESVAERFEEAQIITARALASLDKLLEMTGQFLGGSGEGTRRALFHKGRDYVREIEESRGKWTFDLVIHESRIDAESVILDISNVSRRR